MPFMIGDRVTWTSQADGLTRTKVGEVVEAIPAQMGPTRIRGAGRPRNHESYVVQASKQSDRKRTALYWPRVKHLKSAP